MIRSRLGLVHHQPDCSMLQTIGPATTTLWPQIDPKWCTGCNPAVAAAGGDSHHQLTHLEHLHTRLLQANTPNTPNTVGSTTPDVTWATFHQLHTQLQAAHNIVQPGGAIGAWLHATTTALRRSAAAITNSAYHRNHIASCGNPNDNWQLVTIRHPQPNPLRTDLLHQTWPDPDPILNITMLEAATAICWAGGHHKLYDGLWTILDGAGQRLLHRLQQLTSHHPNLRIQAIPDTVTVLTETPPPDGAHPRDTSELMLRAGTIQFDASDYTRRFHAVTTALTATPAAPPAAQTRPR